jgi:hypothetical protein
MRFLIASLVLVAVVCFGPAAWPVLAWAQGQPAQGKIDVDVNVGHSGGSGTWWNNPMWIAIGAIAIVLLIVIVAMAARGSGTTVIKE